MTRPVENIPEEELIIEREMAVEQHGRLVGLKRYLGSTIAELDGYADGDFAAGPTARMRESMEHLREARELVDSEAAVVVSRLEAIDERIEEVDLND